MSFNPNISEGSCYYDSSGNEAPSRFIPCGNSEGGHVTCCESQDNCLSSRACYNPQYGVTYLAGCTDKNYKDSACPYKGSYSDQPWVGLVYCNGTSHQWTGCREDKEAETVSIPQPCWCPQTSRDVLFEDASVLDNSMHLPTATGESVTWFVGVGPSSSASRTSHATGSQTSTTEVTSSGTNEASSSNPTIPSSANATSAMVFPTLTSSSNPQKNLTTGAKVGIGVAAGVGGLASLIISVLLIRRCLSGNGKSTGKSNGQSTSTEQHDSGQSSQPDYSDLRSPACPGRKSELPKNESKLTPSPTNADFGSNKSEVEGSPAIGGPGRPISTGGYEMPGQKGAVFEMPG